MRYSLRHRLTASLVLVTFLASTAPVAGLDVTARGNAESGQTVLTNDDVLQMVTANLSEGLILNQIRTSRTAFDLSVAEIIRLSTNGVSDTIITAMQAAARAPDASRPPLADSPPEAPPAAATPPPAVTTSPPVVPTPAPSPPAEEETMANGLVAGEQMAQKQTGTGRAGAGFAVGLLTGFIGTGIGYAVLGPAPLSRLALLALEEKNDEYQMGFQNGWKDETKSAKRSSFVKGGVFGSIIAIAAFVIYYTTSQDLKQKVPHYNQ